MRVCLLIGLATICATSASAQEMNAQALYEAGVALKAQGPLALVTPEFRVVRVELQAAADAARAKARADKAAGRKPRFCAPEGEQTMGSGELIRRVETIPEAERRKIDSQEMMTRVLAQKYPCA